MTEGIGMTFGTEVMVWNNTWILFIPRVEASFKQGVSCTALIQLSPEHTYKRFQIKNYNYPKVYVTFHNR